MFNSSLFSHFQPTTVNTPYGSVIVYTDRGKDGLIFIQRHHADAKLGAEVYQAPHLINHRANFYAISQFKVDAILAVCSVGSLNKKLESGTLVIPNDYFSLFCPTFSMYDDKRSHIVPSLDKQVRNVIIEALTSTDVQKLCTDDTVYVQTTGPCFETPAEIRFLSKLGDVVGMTAASEAIAAKELNLRYAIVAMIDNMGNGLAEKELTHEEFIVSVAKHQFDVEKAVKSSVMQLLSHRFE